jgi:cellulose synthase/poly-beta-1,6-N-acetylglucosamine synthase-like glycosyltransferase
VSATVPWGAITHPLEILVLVFVAYGAVTALFGWPTPRIASRGDRTRRFRIVIPAHDEAHVLGALLSDITEQDYSRPLVTTWVVADRCKDDTAAVAAAAGAAVDTRTVGSSGKGAALDWHLQRHPLAEDEVLLVVDADNRIPPNLLARFADELDAGSEVLQAYLDVTNPGASPLATAGAVSYWASNRMIQQARRRLGWSADLGGTGMAMTAPALERAGGFGDSLAEDADLGVRLTLAGATVDWVHDVRVADEKPATLAATVGQRARWAAGRRAAARRHFLALVGESVRRRSLGLFDLALRLIQPGRTLLALLSGVVTAAALVWAPHWLLPAPWWLVATGIQVLAPLPFLVRDGVPARYVVRYPALLLLAGLAIPIRLVSRVRRTWYHTRHRGVSPPDPAPSGGPDRDP